jgi:hypothetical protein
MEKREFRFGDDGFAEALAEARLPADGIVRVEAPIEFRDLAAPAVAASEPAAPATLRPLTFVASSQRVARDGDMIEAKAWRLDEFRKNPAFLWCHDVGMPPLGTVTPKVIRKDEKLGPHLEATVSFDDQSPFARYVHGLYDRKIMRAVSVGFRTLGFRIPPLEERQELGLSEWGIVVTAAELCELSAVSVGSDPDALMKRAFDALPATEDREFRFAVLEALANQQTAIEELRACLEARKTSDSTAHPSGDAGDLEAEDTVPPETRGEATSAPDYFEFMERVGRGLTADD